MLKIIQPPSNSKVFKIALDMGNATKHGIRAGFLEFGNLLERELRDEIKRKPKSGREYRIRRGSRRYRHIASAPGETPASISGNLRRSVAYEVQGSSRLEFGYDNSVEYGRYLEDGTKKMASRPGIRNAIDKTETRAVELMSRTIYNKMVKK